MDHTYWHKQSASKPLFDDLLWSRPETKAMAGKLLIIGGNAHGFAAAGEAYTTAQTAGVGTVRVLLPDSLQKTVGRVFEAGEYAPSTPSGSFSQKALDECLNLSLWADGVLLVGDLGRNSETAILLEKFVGKYNGRLALTQDAADYFTKLPQNLLKRKDTLLVITMAQLQKIAVNSKFPDVFRFDMNYLKIIEQLHEFTKINEAAIAMKHLNAVFVAVDGQVSTTEVTQDMEMWRVQTAARAAVWWLQNPAKPFEAITTSIVE